MGTFGRQLRDRFVLDSDLFFLNHGSFGATPKSVLEAQSVWRMELERNPVAFIVDRLPGLQRAAAERLARFLGTTGECLGFVENATTAVNAVIRSLELGPGDEVVTLSHVYGAVHNALRFVCARSGATLRVIDVPFPLSDPDEVVEALRGGLGPKTRFALLDHITSATGLVLPIEQMVALCRENGVPVMVDGAHAPGHVSLSLDALGADWYTGNAHKWLFAPKGCAFLYASPDVQHATHPTVISHPYEQGFVAEFDYTGTKDPSAWLAVEAALDFVDSLGSDAIRTYNHSLAIDVSRRIQERWGTAPLAPDSMLGCIVTLRGPGDALGTTLDEAAKVRRYLLDQHRVEVPVFPFAGQNWVRISAQVYNEACDYDPLIEALLSRADSLGDG